MRRDQWFVAYTIGRCQEMSESFHDVKLMLPPKDRFWADPFPIEHDGEYFIFIEEVEHRNGKGYISVIRMNPDGGWQQPVKVLDKAYHLSHPFVFRWQGEYYMIPESAANKTIELYRCRSFPLEWELEKVLLNDVQAVDATVAEIDGLWWLFTNVAAVDGASTNDELHLFYADTPLGPWVPHRRNPVKSDVRSARPAGALFRWKGALYRPAQDSSVAYGQAISINRVERLTPTEFVETEASKVLPLWHRNLSRNHTLNHAGALTVIDGLRQTRRLF